MAQGETGPGRPIGIGIVVIHVLVLTFLMNIGKCVPLAAYGDEATLRERVALSLGMFPRGEVGIGVLLVSLEISIRRVLWMFQVSAKAFH